MTKRPLYIGDEVSWIVVIVSGTSQNHKMVVVPWQIAVHDDCFTDLHVGRRVLPTKQITSRINGSYTQVAQNLRTPANKPAIKN